jgi:hypothetical protein
MKCVECGREKAADERGWVTVLSPSGEMRIHYCCDCMEELLGHKADVKNDHARQKEQP